MTQPTLSGRIGSGTPPQIGEVPQRGGGVINIKKPCDNNLAKFSFITPPSLRDTSPIWGGVPR